MYKLHSDGFYFPIGTIQTPPKSTDKSIIGKYIHHHIYIRKFSQYPLHVDTPKKVAKSKWSSIPRSFCKIGGRRQL